MALLNSLKKLFGTSKDLGAAKVEELKDKTAPVVENAKEYSKDVIDKVEGAIDDVKESAQAFGEKVKNLGEDIAEKAAEKLDKLEETAENFVEDLNAKLQAKIPKNEAATPPDDLVEETAVEAADAKEPIANAEKDVEKLKE